MHDRFQIERFDFEASAGPGCTPLRRAARSRARAARAVRRRGRAEGDAGDGQPGRRRRRGAHRRPALVVAQRARRWADGDRHRRDRGRLRQHGAGAEIDRNALPRSRTRPTSSPTSATGRRATAPTRRSPRRASSTRPRRARCWRGPTFTAINKGASDTLAITWTVTIGTRRVDGELLQHRLRASGSQRFRYGALCLCP